MSRCGGRPSWISERPHGCPGVVGRPSWMSGSGRVAPPDVQVVGRPSRMSKSGQETLLDDREALSDVREWLRGSLGCL